MTYGRKFKWNKITSNNTNRAIRDTNADKTTVLLSHLWNKNAFFKRQLRLNPFHHPNLETPTLVSAARRGPIWTTSEGKLDAFRRHCTNEIWRRILGVHALHVLYSNSGEDQTTEHITSGRCALFWKPGVSADLASLLPALWVLLEENAFAV